MRLEAEKVQGKYAHMSRIVTTTASAASYACAKIGSFVSTFLSGTYSPHLLTDSLIDGLFDRLRLLRDDSEFSSCFNHEYKSEYTFLTVSTPPCSLMVLPNVLIL